MAKPTKTKGKPTTETAPYSLRFPVDSDMPLRLKKASEACQLPERKLLQDAAEKLVETIERNGYRVVLPIEFALTHVAVRNPELDRK